LQIYGQHLITSFIGYPNGNFHKNYTIKAGQKHYLISHLAISGANRPVRDRISLFGIAASFYERIISMRNTLGQRIRYLREEKNLSQVEMAAQLNISNVQLNRYETGARKPDPETLVRIADFLNVSTDYLLGRSLSIMEAPLDYPGKEEQQLMHRLRKFPELIPFINELTESPDLAEKIIRIWKIIHTD
jgi:transcriptional regulator with XRE-family HTH domain